MLLHHCLKCRKNTESKNPKVAKTKNRRIMLFDNVTRQIREGKHLY